MRIVGSLHSVSVQPIGHVGPAVQDLADNLEELGALAHIAKLSELGDGGVQVLRHLGWGAEVRHLGRLAHLDHQKSLPSPSLSSDSRSMRMVLVPMRRALS